MATLTFIKDPIELVGGGTLQLVGGGTLQWVEGRYVMVEDPVLPSDDLKRCQNVVNQCLPCNESPVLNLSAEGDSITWLGYVTLPRPPPPGPPWTSLGCLGWRFSTVSQADADEQAMADAAACVITDPPITPFTWPDYPLVTCLAGSNPIAPLAPRLVLDGEVHWFYPSVNTPGINALFFDMLLESPRYWVFDEPHIADGVAPYCLWVSDNVAAAGLLPFLFKSWDTWGLYQATGVADVPYSGKTTKCTTYASAFGPCIELGCFEHPAYTISHWEEQALWCSQIDTQNCPTLAQYLTFVYGDAFLGPWTDKGTPPTNLGESWIMDCVLGYDLEECFGLSDLSKFLFGTPIRGLAETCPDFDCQAEQDDDHPVELRALVAVREAGVPATVSVQQGRYAHRVGADSASPAGLYIPHYALRMDYCGNRRAQLLPFPTSHLVTHALPPP